MKKAFVTGGSGYLGRNLIRYLKSGSCEGVPPVPVVAIGRSDTAIKAVKDAGADETPKADVSDVTALAAAMKGCDIVFHCAARAELWGSLADFRKINVEGTKNVIQACKDAGVRRLVHVSSEQAVLSATRDLIRATETMDYPDDSPGPYAITKKESEICAREANGVDLETVVVRPRFIWGCDDSTVLPNFIKATESGDLKWFNGGEYLTSTCHVTNVCEGCVLAATKGPAGEVYYLTDGEPVVFKTFISDMLNAVGVTPPTATIPFWLVKGVACLAETWGNITGKEPMITRPVLYVMGKEVTVDDKKARELLGYRSQVSVSEGIQDLNERHKATEQSSSK